MTHEPNSRNPVGCSGLTLSLNTGYAVRYRSPKPPYRVASHIRQTLGDMHLEMG